MKKDMELQAGQFKQTIKRLKEDKENAESQLVDTETALGDKDKEQNSHRDQ